MSGSMFPTTAPEESLELLRAAHKNASERLLESGAVAPTAVIIGPTSCVIFALSMENEEEKDRQPFIARALAIKHRADSVTFTSESWQVVLKTEEDKKLFQKWREENPGGSFDDFEGRAEIVLFIIETFQGRLRYTTPIIRAHGEVAITPINEADISWSPMGSKEWKEEAQGRMTNFLLPVRELYDDPRVQALADHYLGERTNSQDITKEVLQARED